MQRKLLVVLLIIVCVGGVKYALSHENRGMKPAAVSNASAKKFDTSQYSLANPESIWVVVNKARPLTPPTYEPTDLVLPTVPQRVPGNESMQIRAIIEQPLYKMFAAAKAAGAPLMLSSGYRSFGFQSALYGSYVTAHGQSQADAFSARPSYSEHQTGLAIDVEPIDQQCDVDQCFAELPAGKWVAAHAAEYGFIIRYPEGKTQTTGYEYEPWHLRYVGAELALEMQKTQTSTLEEFFKLPPAADYVSN